MASKTLWEQMSGKEFYLDSFSSRRRLSKCFSKTQFNMNGQDAGLGSWGIYSPLFSQHIWITRPVLGTCRENTKHSWCAAGAQRPYPASRGTGGQWCPSAPRQAGGSSEEGMLPSPRGLCHTGAQVHPPSAQEASYSTNPDVGKTQLKIMNILRYISLMKEVDTCMDQAPLQLPNRI